MPAIRRALLLCAGRGIRLMPLTADRPKPMIELGGQPILERILHMLRHAGIEEAVIVHGYLGDAIETYFGDGSRVGMRLLYREQQELTGTAGAMLLAEDLCGDEPFLLHWGDILVDPQNIHAELELFAAKQAQCVLNVTWVEDPWAGGAIYRDGARVLRAIEKPPRGTGHTHWIIGGVIAFAPLLWRYLHETQPPEHGEYFVTQAIDLMAQRGEIVLAHETIGQRIHISSPQDVAALHDDPRLIAWQPCASTEMTLL